MSINNTTLALITERAKALNNDNISLSEKVCFASSDFIYAQQHPEFANAHGGLENLKKDFVAFVEQWHKQQSDPWHLFSQALNQMISANKTFLALWDYADGDVSPESLLEHFSTIQMDVGRLTGKTNYIAHHAIDDACAIVYSDKAKQYMLRFNPVAHVLTVDEFMDCQNTNASTAFIDDPFLVFAIKNREDIVKKSCTIGIKMLILLGH